MSGRLSVPFEPCPDCGLKAGFSPHADQCTSEQARKLNQGVFDQAEVIDVAPCNRLLAAGVRD